MSKQNQKLYDAFKAARNGQSTWLNLPYRGKLYRVQIAAMMKTEDDTWMFCWRDGFYKPADSIGYIYHCIARVNGKIQLADFSPDMCNVSHRVNARYRQHKDIFAVISGPLHEVKQ